MKKSNFIFTFTFLILSLVLVACNNKIDNDSLFMDISRKGFAIDGAYVGNKGSYYKISDANGSYIRYDYSNLNLNNDSPYEIKEIEYVNSDVGSDKPYLISYPEHNITVDYEDDNEILQNQLNEFLNELDLTLDELDSFMLWVRENKPMLNKEW